MAVVATAERLLQNFKGDNYSFGSNNLECIGAFVRQYGKSVLVIANSGKWLQPLVREALDSLAGKGLRILGGVIPGSGANTPQEDVYRIEENIRHYLPDCLVAIGGGSTIDAVKAANILATLGHGNTGIVPYFGTGLVTQALLTSNKKLFPMVAVQTAAGSAAHLTKYSNVTDTVSGQKKLVVDEAIIPNKAVFDYAATITATRDLTVDGALDGLAHCLEVYYGASLEKRRLIAEISLTGMELILANTKKALNTPTDISVRTALGLGTDLGGYAIMVGGTNGPHLNSFSLVNLTSHGRACGIALPYYTVMFAPVIQEQLRLVGTVLERLGMVTESSERLDGRALGLAVAKGLISFNKSIGAPSKFVDLPGFNDAYIERALRAAKDPQLAMKLKNMPAPLEIRQIDEYMGAVLNAAKEGDLNLVKTI